LIRVVGAVIMNEKEKILCAKRSSSMSLPGKWEFPGGKIENGEDEKAALIREIREELHCEIHVGTKITETIHEYPGKTVLLITYFAKLVNGNLTATEHEQVMWLKKDQLHTLDWAEADLPTVELICF